MAGMNTICFPQNNDSLEFLHLAPTAFIILYFQSCQALQLESCLGSIVRHAKPVTGAMPN